MNPQKQFIIDGSNFNNLKSFYNELERTLCSNFHMGRNLNATNDVLRGGFEKFEYEEPIDLIWINSEKSKQDLGSIETAKYLRKSLFLCIITGPYSNISQIWKDLKKAKAGEGETIFDELIEMIEEKEHINLVLE